MRSTPLLKLVPRFLRGSRDQVIIAHHFATHDLLDAFAQQVRLVRGRFGTYEPIDFLALLVGYAISGERTLYDFFERITPFETAFMALFGRRCLPHRSTLSRFLADVDRPCLEAFRTLFQRQSFAEGWTPETIGGVFDRQGRRSIVFDVDATRQAARQRALPCAPGYKGASEVRCYARVPRHFRCTPANGSVRTQGKATLTIAVNLLRRGAPSPPI